MSHTGYILLADDNPTDAELTIRALEIGGVSQQVVWVQDGEAALHYVFRQGVYAQRVSGNPKLMLLDLHMPKIDGLDVLAQIKADPKTRSTPVVIMSSSDQESDMARSYEAHANSYIVKPVDFKQFTDQVSLLGQYWTRINRAGP
ncbi:MAG TPA: response regulator [Steroidobacter sp.]|jgi:CheY-like chemotaxis protein|uniref:Response regulator n=1 Tax=Steroidobacter agaridevorans TaxID=2695856 RepID=A0A829Y4Z3_9GAMM|nr:response regulator [Steroidobacter agaridevorans]MDY6945210.1 response regulator [Pseudomonadota bacterium]GFE78163.1 response regulator [Steroidobacter agaridevorans]GFE91222.1 response regulator [Steroidobacter agaridevorans]